MMHSKNGILCEGSQNSVGFETFERPTAFQFSYSLCYAKFIGELVLDFRPRSEMQRSRVTWEVADRLVPQLGHLLIRGLAVLVEEMYDAVSDSVRNLGRPFWESSAFANESTRENLTSDACNRRDGKTSRISLGNSHAGNGDRKMNK
jgi:hypothetical protein